MAPTNESTEVVAPTQRFTSFEAFYPYYLSEHSHPWTRRLHFTGTTLAMGAALCGQWLMVPIVGYGFAWTSHQFVEHNRPATFTYPVYSFFGDLRMWSEMVGGKHWVAEESKPEQEPLVR